MRGSSRLTTIRVLRDLPRILNERRLTGRTTTSGQPIKAERAEIGTLGVTHIVNLGPHRNKGALAGEPGTAAGPDRAVVSKKTHRVNRTRSNLTHSCQD